MQMAKTILAKNFNINMGGRKLEAISSEVADRKQQKILRLPINYVNKTVLVSNS